MSPPYPPKHNRERTAWAGEASPGPLQPVVGNEKLTWGVELEFLFAYKDQVVKDILERKGGKFELVKNIPRKERQYDASKKAPYQFTKTPDVELPNHAYNSWGMKEKGKQDARNRPLVFEPLFMVQEKIRRHTTDLPTVVYVDSHTHNTKDAYNEWIISVDRTVPGVGPRNVHQRLSSYDKRTERGARGMWDSYGIELISPVFETDTNRGGGRGTIREILAAVAAEERGTDAFITNQCGLHVHIGDPNGFKLEELQTLAYLLVIYEEELSKLHPPARRPGHRVSYDNIESNRSGLILEGRTNADKLFEEDFWHYTRSMQQSNEFTDARYKKHISVRAIKKWAADQQSVDSLVERFNWRASKDRPGLEHGNRLRQVNFVPLTRTREDLPKTIEFRAARGTLKEEEVTRWVDVCLGLVRLAKYYAGNPEEFPVIEWGDEFSPRRNGILTRSRINVFDLLNLMGIGKKEIEWWQDRKATWSNVMVLSAEARSKNEHFRDDLEDLSVPDDAEEADEDGEASSSVSRPQPRAPTGRRMRAGDDAPSYQGGSPRMRHNGLRRQGGAQLSSPDAAQDTAFDPVEPGLGYQNRSANRTRRRLFGSSSKSKPGAPVGSDLPPGVKSGPLYRPLSSHISLRRHTPSAVIDLTRDLPTSARSRLRGRPQRQEVIDISDDGDSVGDDSEDVDFADTDSPELVPSRNGRRSSPASSPPPPYLKRNRDDDGEYGDDDEADNRGKRSKTVHFAASWK